MPIPIPIRLSRRSSSSDAPPIRRRPIQALLALGMLALVLVLVGLLASCACRPTVDPARLERLMVMRSMDRWDSEIAIDCVWRF